MIIMMMMHKRVTFSLMLVAVVMMSWSSVPSLTEAFHYPFAGRALVTASRPGSSSRNHHHRRDRHRTAVGTRMPTRMSSWSDGADAMNKIMDPSSSSMPSYIRWKTTSASTANSNHPPKWELQTAVTRFQRDNHSAIVDLHAQVHVGSQDYFDYYNHQLHDMDRVHYELLIDQDLLLKFSNSSQILKQSIMATPNDRQFAQQYGWKCQLDVIEYCQPHWFHADLTRQELLSQVDDSHGSNQQQEPLWKQVGGGGGTFLQPALSALLVGPPTLFWTASPSSSSSSSSPQEEQNRMMTMTANRKDDRVVAYRRLFTNLFLPGNTLAVTLRGILWMTVPSPELSILLLDWSSLLFPKAKTTRSSNKSSSSSAIVFSKLALPVLQALSTLQFLKLRQLIFGQQLVQSSSVLNSNNGNPQQNPKEWSLLITQRNDHALQILQSSMKECLQQKMVHPEMDHTVTATTTTKMALLYGSSHCPDLHAKLIQDGWTATETTWRTAWTIDLDDGRNLRNNDSICTTTTFSPSSWMGLWVLLPLYLVIGGMDWITAVQDTAVEFLNEKDYAEAALVFLFYIFRHVLLYVGLSKFILDLDSTTTSTSTTDN